MKFDPTEKQNLLSELTERNPRRPLALVLSCVVSEPLGPMQTVDERMANGTGPIHALCSLLGYGGFFENAFQVHIGLAQKKNAEIAFVGLPRDLSLFVSEWQKTSLGEKLAPYLPLTGLRLTRPGSDVLRLDEPGARIDVFDPPLLEAADRPERQRLVRSLILQI